MTRSGHTFSPPVENSASTSNDLSYGYLLSTEELSRQLEDFALRKSPLGCRPLSDRRRSRSRRVETCQGLEPDRLNHYRSICHIFASLSTEICYHHAMKKRKSATKPGTKKSRKTMKKA